VKLKHFVGALVVVLVTVCLLAEPVAAMPPEQFDVTFGRWQQHWDLPVQAGKAERSWMWGNVIATTIEPYAGDQSEKYSSNGILVRTNGERDVRYFDKGRMEYWPGRADQFPEDNPWAVTTGLLATELMTGRLQLGNDTFEQHKPSQVPVAGDPDSGDITPSYADMGKVMDYRPVPKGWTIIQTIDADGKVGADQALANYGVKTMDVGAPTNHGVASVFWSWMNQSGVVYDTRPIDVVGNRDRFTTQRLFPNPFYATGDPTTNAYWTKTRVAGVVRDVLVQCFQRRCMTYTPTNPGNWKVEMANIGQHYYHWRYVEIPAEKSASNSAN